MKRQNLMKLLMPIGMLITGIPLFLRHYVAFPDAMDFIQGLGVGMVIMSFFIQRFKPTA
jgi:hypothetical protein